MRKEVKYMQKKIAAIYTAYYFDPTLDLVEAMALIRSNTKPIRDFLAVSRGYKNWTEFRAVACARQNKALAFDRAYSDDEE